MLDFAVLESRSYIKTTRTKYFLLASVLVVGFILFILLRIANDQNTPYNQPQHPDSSFEYIEEAIYLKKWRLPPNQKNLLSICTIPKSPRNYRIARTQYNSLESWKRLHPKPDITLFEFGNGQPINEYARENGVKFVSDIKKNKYGTPYFDDAVSKCEETASTPYVMFINTDIITPPWFAPAVYKAIEQFKDTDMMIVGPRLEAPPGYRIDFNDPLWAFQLWNETEKRFFFTAIDFFIFRKGTFPTIPPFLIGRFAFDNWLLQNAIDRNIPLIHTKWIGAVIHQPHPYTHVPDDIMVEEKAYNYQVGKRRWKCGYLSQAPYALEICDDDKSEICIKDVKPLECDPLRK